MMVLPTSRVGIYARVSASDQDQNPGAQVVPLRAFVVAQGWRIAGEFVDHAAVTDLRARVGWRDLLGQAGRRALDLVLVWGIDRAFQSVREAAATLERLRGWNVGLRSYSEPWLDTTGRFGEAIYRATVAYARLEGTTVSPRASAGIGRATRRTV